MSIPHARVKLGKRRPRYDRRTLQFTKYLSQSLPPAPDEVSWVTQVSDWPMYLNDQIGDCVIAAAAHMIEQWTVYAGNPKRIGDSDVLSGYEAVGGYVPGDPSTDNGCDMLTALNYWRHVGFGGHKILGYMAFNWLNLAQMRLAIQLFGNVFMGLALPSSAQGQDVWTVTQGGTASPIGMPGSWGGHCVPFDASSLKSHTSVSWANLLKLSLNFGRDYIEEGYVVLSEDFIEANGVSASGFKLDQLLKDLRGF